ncbi:hypothetical protein DPMN_045221 [Dreissena polymorpha]|uniref:Uncharacterized protein n=1 Tax=Dreissena polymorpha TaxID=45954 RepID=A0A9D4D3Y2_DREPO|nr:hypothetical protein DPMN_045221 [Dreissena polymorpha]
MRKVQKTSWSVILHENSFLDSADKLLERYAFRILRNYLKRNPSIHQTDDVRKLDVYDAIKCAFHRSGIPRTDWLEFPSIVYNSDFMDKGVDRTQVTGVA